MSEKWAEDQLDYDDTILRNIRLIATSYNIFIFIGIPILLFAYVTFSVRCIQSESISQALSKGFFVLGVVIFPCLVAGTFITRAETVQKQLERQGYVQRPTGARRVDFAINWVVLAAFAYWIRYHERRERQSETMGMQIAWLNAVLGAFMIWLLLIMMSIGSVVWFTVKARELERR